MSLGGALLRYECAKLLDGMPEDALPELLEFMKDATYFYVFRPTINKEPMKIKTIKARLGRTVIRPEFPISEQENL